MATLNKILEFGDDGQRSWHVVTRRSGDDWTYLVMEKRDDGEEGEAYSLRGGKATRIDDDGGDE